MHEEVSEALKSIMSRRLPYADLCTRVHAVPGLYAFFGDKSVWKGLGLNLPSDDRPLYVGKAEKSLLRRPISDHFGDRSRSRRTSPTGSSSPRRSVAALIGEQLSLNPIPRNPSLKKYFDRYGFSYDDDRKLTNWMRENLLIGWYECLPSCNLAGLETSVARTLEPPLFLDSIFSPAHGNWVQNVKLARAGMAAKAALACSG